MSFRVDRAATVQVFHPFKRLFPGAGTAVPILMYHSVSDDGGLTAHPYFETRTSVSRFAEQMRWLRDNSYSSLTLDDVIAHMQQKASLPAKPVVITFDDGFADFYRNAFPILQENSLVATMFLATGFVSNTREQFKGNDCLTWTEIRDLQKHGIRFGSHTVNHPQLHSETTDSVRYELQASKESIEQATGTPVSSFAYPFAFPENDRRFVESLSDFLAEFGYASSVCTAIGRAKRGDGQYFLRRLPINDWDDLKLFQAKLEGAYDWLGVIQRLKKRIYRA